MKKTCPPSMNTAKWPATPNVRCVMSSSGRSLSSSASPESFPVLVFFAVFAANTRGEIPYLPATWTTRSWHNSYNTSTPIRIGTCPLMSANKNAVASPSLIARAMLQAVITAAPMYPTPKLECKSATLKASSSNNERSTWLLEFLSQSSWAILLHRPVRRSASKTKEYAKVATQASELGSVTTSAKDDTNFIVSMINISVEARIPNAISMSP
mmetsp:Transcript_18221/g.64065  ORF Transcript_18221/g.64065 Transcript_18221/m.64065 type:complete len:212 (+) Transcript_18221:143-778(+)